MSEGVREGGRRVKGREGGGRRERMEGPEGVKGSK